MLELVSNTQDRERTQLHQALTGLLITEFPQIHERKRPGLVKIAGKMHTMTDEQVSWSARRLDRLSRDTAKSAQDLFEIDRREADGNNLAGFYNKVYTAVLENVGNDEIAAHAGLNACRIMVFCGELAVYLGYDGSNHSDVYQSQEYLDGTKYLVSVIEKRAQLGFE